MKQYIFNEKIDIEQKMKCGYVDISNPCKTIRELARYNHFAGGLNKTDSYKMIDAYMREHYTEYAEVGFYKSIEGCVKDAAKGAWKNIDGVVITESEMSVISALADERKERIAFVMLADAKYDNVCKNRNSDVTYLSMRDIYRTAKVSMPVAQRADFLHFVYEFDLVDINLNPESNAMRLKFVSHKPEDAPVIVLNEMDYKDLSNTYLQWKHSGYKRCKICGRWIKVRKNTQYCKDCKPKYEPMDCKTVVCVDCGIKFIVDVHSRNKKRCDECQSKFLLSSKHERNKRYYSGKSSENVEFKT